MATFSIAEFTAMAKDANGNVLQIGAMPPKTTQSVSYTTSAQSAAFGAETKFIRVISSAAAHVVFGANPTATAAAPWVAANTEQWFAVTPGQKVAAYDGST